MGVQCTCLQYPEVIKNANTNLSSVNYSKNTSLGGGGVGSATPVAFVDLSKRRYEYNIICLAGGRVLQWQPVAHGEPDQGHAEGENQSGPPAHLASERVCILTNVTLTHPTLKGGGGYRSVLLGGGGIRERERLKWGKWTRKRKIGGKLKRKY